jgi:hypothetical protein
VLASNGQPGSLILAIARCRQQIPANQWLILASASKSGS